MSVSEVPRAKKVSGDFAIWAFGQQFKEGKKSKAQCSILLLGKMCIFCLIRRMPSGVSEITLTPK